MSLKADARDSYAPWREGTRVGGYRVVRRVAVGGMAEVYEAEHVSLGGRVAIKRLLPALADRGDVVRRFVREGRVSAALVHPHIARVHDAGEADGAPYLVMELVDGVDLRARLADDSPMSPAEVLALLRPVAEALTYAHARGVVHRDLKPGNVMLGAWPDGSPRPVVVDFGLARGAGALADSLVTGDAELLGTPAYFAPELCEGSAAPSASTDQYALGVIAYECLTGRRPFEGANLAALVRAILDDALTPPRALRPDVPQAMSGAVARALSRDPTARFASVADFSAALSGDDRDALATAPPPPSSAPRPRWRVALVTVAMVGLGVVSAASTRGVGSTAPPPRARSADAPSPGSSRLPPPLPSAVSAPVAPGGALPVHADAFDAGVLRPRRGARRSSAGARGVAADAGATRERCIGPNGVNLCL